MYGLGEGEGVLPCDHTNILTELMYLLITKVHLMNGVVVVHWVVIACNHSSIFLCSFCAMACAVGVLMNWVASLTSFSS